MNLSLNSIEEIARLIKTRRKDQDMTQAELALVSNVGVRFISDIENAKDSCQIGLVIRVLKELGVRLEGRENSPSKN